MSAKILDIEKHLIQHFPGQVYNMEKPLAVVFFLRAWAAKHGPGNKSTLRASKWAKGRENGFGDGKQ